MQLGARLRTESLFATTAESCTGGWIAKTFTDIAGSSDWYSGGVVTYSNELKERLLRVERATMVEHGVVSEPVVRQMAQGALDAVQADCAVSVSGVAGPGGGTADKPVGMVWIAAAVRRPTSRHQARDDHLTTTSSASDDPGTVRPVQVKARVYQFAGSRDDVRRAAVAAAMDLLVQVLDSD